jgi:4-hydroxy-4-methyl-2-oxoglutarate aldolase
MMVIGAHAADFVWRAGGALAVTAETGAAASVIALSYGERGESGELWKEEGQTVELVKEVRAGEARRAAAALGAEFDCLDLGDYPLEVDVDALRLISERIREFAPDVLITHTDTDPFNPDHPVASAAVMRARSLAAGAGVQSAFKTVRPPELFLQLHADDVRRHHAGDRPQAGGDGRDEGSEVSAELLRRASRSPRQPRAPLVSQQRDSPGGGLPAGHAAGGERAVTGVYEELAALGSATVYEAGGRRGYVDADLVQVVPGSRAAGPARTVRCGQDDNLMVHAVMAEVQPGEVIVLSMPEPRPVALVGDLLAAQAKAHGAAAILVDASVRDVEELAELGLPIWARWIRVRGAGKDLAGEIGSPVTVGGATIRAGDVVVLDADGAAVVESERVPDVLEASRERAERERIKRTKLKGGALSFDLDGLRERIEGGQR